MMQHDDLTHFGKLLDEFEQDALAAVQGNSNTPSEGKRYQRDLTRRNVMEFVENIVQQRDHLVDELNVQPKGAVAEKVAP